MPGTLAAFINALEPQGMRMIFAAAGSDPFGDITFNKVLVGCAALLSCWLLVLKIMAHYRRSPSVDQTFATKEELAKVEAALTERGDERKIEIESRIKEMSSSLTKQMVEIRTRMEVATLRENTDLQAIQRQLGELAGYIKAMSQKKV